MHPEPAGRPDRSTLATGSSRRVGLARCRPFRPAPGSATTNPGGQATLLDRRRTDPRLPVTGPVGGQSRRCALLDTTAPGGSLRRRQARRRLRGPRPGSKAGPIWQRAHHPGRDARLVTIMWPAADARRSRPVMEMLAADRPSTSVPPRAGTTGRSLGRPGTCCGPTASGQHADRGGRQRDPPGGLTLGLGVLRDGRFTPLPRAPCRHQQRRPGSPRRTHRLSCGSAGAGARPGSTATAERPAGQQPDRRSHR